MLVLLLLLMLRLLLYVLVAVTPVVFVDLQVFCGALVTAAAGSFVAACVPRFAVCADGGVAGGTTCDSDDVAVSHAPLT